MTSRDVAALRFALKTAKDANVDENVIAEAESILAVEGPKQEARDLLDDGYKNSNIAALESALAAAKKAALDPQEYAKHIQKLDELKAKVKAMGDINTALEESKKIDERNIDLLRKTTL